MYRILGTEFSLQERIIFKLLVARLPRSGILGHKKRAHSFKFLMQLHMINGQYVTVLHEMLRVQPSITEDSIDGDQILKI